jgi:predicted kinase
MTATLVIFSGLPGTGKSALADRLARKLRLPLLRIDDVVGALPASMRGYDIPFWDAMIAVLLQLAEAQLALGLSVAIDSVFMRNDRLHAQELARAHGAAFRPVYTFVSDEKLWEARVTARFERSNPADGVATWERIREQRKNFQHWQPGTALFVDAVQPLEQNFAAVLAFVTGAEPHLTPLPVDIPLVKGNYHG